MQDGLKILVVEDDLATRNLCVGSLRDCGQDVHAVTCAEEAISALACEQFDVALVDLILPGLSGLDLLKTVQPDSSGTDVVLMTGFASVSTAVEAMKLGAYDYVAKPFSSEELVHLFARLAERRSLKAENQLLRGRVGNEAAFSGMVGASAKMQEVFRAIVKIAQRSAPVLIQGETGTGKELAARAVHDGGPRRACPFLTIDCAGFSASLIESELFGHTRGAFTGAVANRAGLLAKAGDGTIFLDEIGELPIELQAKLLRVVQQGEFRPVGSAEVLKVRARFIAATNVDLETAVAEKRFRADLYHRLNVHKIVLPPLRQRLSDIPALVDHFLRERAEPGSKPVTMSRAAGECLMQYHWPGNVRELENCLERTLGAMSGPVLNSSDLPPNIRAPLAHDVDSGTLSLLEQAEKRTIVEVLEQADGNRARAASMLGVAKTTVYRKMRQYGIPDGRGYEQ